ncbi:MAG: cellulase family glycosylhydrolase [Bacteroidota bacterium]
MILLKHYSLLLLFICASLGLAAQLSPQIAVAEMGRGINLGNTLEPPLEGAWNNGPAQESYFDAYLAAGFKNIRIPVRWDQHTGNAAPFTIDSTWMNRVEQVVDWGLSRGFYITLNGHHEDWLKNNYSNPTLRARYDSIWVQVAERFKNKSDSLLFEIINEPIGMTVAEVDDLNQRILGIIRQTNPTRIVIYSGNRWSNSAELLNAAIPNDNYIIGYYHAYDPWQFSGQGQGTWGTSNDYQQMTNKYQTVKNWSVANNIPIHHSEFGAVRSADFNSRMRIYAHNVEQCIVNGFAFSVWDDGGDFRILNRGNNTWPEEKDILVHYHQDSPNQIFSTFTPDPNTNDPTIVVDWNNRATGNDSIVLERSVGAGSSYVQIAKLAPTADTYTDLAVEAGKTYTYRMYTHRADGTLLHGYPTRLRIIATVQSPFNLTPIAIPGVLEVEEYDNGGEGLAYHDSEPANIPGGFRQDEGVDIGAFGNGYILEYVASGEWIEYTVDVEQAGRYSVKADIASEVANGTYSISFEKNNATTNFTAPNTGSWTGFQEVNASNEIELEAGVQQFRLSITNNNPFNIDHITFTLEAASSAEEDARLAGFTISPNPTDDWLEVALPENLRGQPMQLSLQTLTGQTVKSWTTREGALRLDLDALPSGLYLLQLSAEDTHLVHRVMIR